MMHIAEKKHCELITKLIQESTPIMEIARRLDISYFRLKSTYGNLLEGYKPRSRLDTSRDADMCDRYKSGQTLQTIGDVYSVTRERVRQILSRYGLTGKSGGQYTRCLAEKT